ncbi:hypothetical protein Tco_0633653, partial [Tanacetum coccineum]
MFDSSADCHNGTTSNAPGVCYASTAVGNNGEGSSAVHREVSTALTSIVRTLVLVMSLLTTSETSDITSLSSLASVSSLACETRWGLAVFDLMPCLSTIVTSRRACVGVVSSTLSAV